jgi:CheY-like chemotaxis protein
MRVFLVDDETLILMMTADMLESLGHEVVAEASTVEKAAALAKAADYDIAVLDVSIAGTRINPVVEIIAGRNLPFIFVTGYSDHALPDEFRDRPHLQKPFAPDRLQGAIERARSFPQPG